MSDEMFMRQALEEAYKAFDQGEVPVGAVLVYQGEVIARAHNLVESLCDPTAHAEMLCIAKGARMLNNWRLLDTVLYCTLEPCPMCAGAIVQSRVPLTVYGTPDPKAGCAGTRMNLLEEPRFNHRTEVIQGVLQEECAELLVSFFRRLRQRPAK